MSKSADDHTAGDGPLPDGMSRVLARFWGSLGPPFLALVALLAGAVALVVTPREEEPQIVVPLADVFVAAPGLGAEQVERQVAIPLESLLTQIDGVEYVYSMSRAGEAVVTVRFYVGEDREDSLSKVTNKILAHVDHIPEAVTSWVVKPVEVDDVPIVVAMLWSADPSRVGPFELRRLAEESALALRSVPRTNRVEVTGGLPRQVRVELNAEALAARRTSPLEVAWALGVSNVRLPAGEVPQAGASWSIDAGTFFRSSAELRRAVVNVVDGRPVHLEDVATVHDGAAEPDTYTWIGFGPAREAADPGSGLYPAVAVSVGKRRGANAVQVARAVERRLAELERDLLPPEARFRIIRNYGETANEKVNDLVSSLLVAMLTVTIFVGSVMGWRAALVVGLAVPICYGATLGINLLTGYTINRVTLFALILALGLLVDDPITGVDNIDRYMRMGMFGKVRGIALAIQEVRSALVMSTIAIVLSFVPMFFITGMMGPYMGPMAINVPLAVIMSTVVAFLITPWLSRLLLRPSTEAEYDVRRSFVYRLYGGMVRPLVTSPKRAVLFLGAVTLLFLASFGLTLFRLVPLKLLPFDNKNELQIVAEMPESATLEQTDGVLREVADLLRTVPEVKEFAGFSGLASPMDFNGMVRHHYMRRGGHVGDLRLTLVPRTQRAHQSHEIALRLRDGIDAIAARHGAILKIVEVPPGPPVVATLTAEVTGPASMPYAELQAAAQTLAERRRREALVVEVDTSVEHDRTRLVFETDKEKAALSGVATEDVALAVRMATQGVPATFLQLASEAQPLPVVLRLPLERRHSPVDLEAMRLIGRPGIAKVREGEAVREAPQPLVPLGEIGRFEQTVEDKTIHRKNLRRVVYVYGELAGRPPGDAILDVAWDRHFARAGDAERPVAGRTYLRPGAGIAWQLPEQVHVKWSGEGEWNVTVRVFRDLGIAFAAALIGILIVLTLQARSVPIALIIMLAIPLTAIGIMPGFWLLNSVGERTIGGYPNPVFFTATAMIGMIALSGIVVRNSLILVEFIHLALKQGMAFEEALVQAGAIRFRPVFLTAGTTMLGNAIITLDPIFNGLAWAVIFGIGASTLFTLGVIPVVYYLAYRNRAGHGVVAESDEEI
jgi:multidrug efflux pump subunit AcrB